MGYLTTITIYNDDFDNIQKEPEHFVENLSLAMSSGAERLFTLSNTVIIQNPRHSSESTVYVQTGNTCVELNPYSSVTMDLMRNNPEFFRECLEVMKKNILVLEQKIKEE
ncbi:MAG: hypothetical protein AAF489_17170 [Bacteroidota bacterium]